MWECHGRSGWQLLQLCQPQPLRRTELAVPAGSENTKGTFGDRVFKGSTGHRALGGAVLCNGQLTLRAGGKRCALGMNVTANNRDSSLLTEQRIWGISVQVSSSVQRPEKEMLCMSPEK